MIESPGRPVPTPESAARRRVGRDGPRVVEFDEIPADSAGPAPVARFDALVPVAASFLPEATSGDDSTANRSVTTARLDDSSASGRTEPARVADLTGVFAARPRVDADDGLDAPADARRRVGVASDRPGRSVPGARRGRAADPAIDRRAARPTATEGTGRAAAAGGSRGDEPGPSPEPGSETDVDAGPEPGSETEPGPEADPETVARAICLRLLTDRARTRQELDQALHRKGVPAETAAAVLERFDDVGLIDDEAFAEQWVRSRHAVRGLGRRALAVELSRKGVSDDIARQALAGVDEEAEDRRARELVERKLRTLRTDTEEQRAAVARKLVGMLARKGYRGGVAYRVVRELVAAHGTELGELDSEPPADD